MDTMATDAGNSSLDQQTYLWWLLLVDGGTTNDIVTAMTAQFDVTEFAVDAALEDVKATLCGVSPHFRIELGLYLQARKDAADARAAKAAAARRGDASEAARRGRIATAYDEIADEKRRLLTIEGLDIVDGGGQLQTSE